MKESARKRVPKKILVIKPSSLGDVVHSLPFLYALHGAFPKSRIHWVIATGLEELLEGNPMVSKLWVINKDQWKHLKRIKGTVAEVRSLFRALKEERYDIVIDLQGLLRSGLVARASRAPVRIGFREAREGSTLFYTHKVKGGRDVHAVDRYLKVAAELGCDTGEVGFPLPLFRESKKIEALKKELDDYAVIVPGARWETKRWPVDRFGRLASLLPMRSIVIGSSADAERGREIEASSGGKALSLAGATDLKDLVALLRGARVVITNDSGPLHLAVACKAPTVSLFGATNPQRTGPYGKNNIVLQSAAPCAPCYKRRCKSTRCMAEISVEQVLKAAGKLIGEEL